MLGISILVHILVCSDNKPSKHNNTYKEQFEIYRLDLENRLHNAYLELEQCKKENRSLLKNYSSLKEEQEVLKDIFARYTGKGIDIRQVTKDGMTYCVTVDDEGEVSIRRMEL